VIIPKSSQMLTSFLRPKHEGDSSTISSAYNKHPMNKRPMYTVHIVKAAEG